MVVVTRILKIKWSKKRGEKEKRTKMLKNEEKGRKKSVFNQDSLSEQYNKLT